ncbi:hypothetical protein B0T17DRAFT_616917 [Bombardia bombarda]|uniref:Uncharacterized protein n=1 Tax=Bombardia bombarda TaxID=252184 RepID=A0AA39WZX7_9PEZI|nr:hypothetical protein B0T17DRAFT_616917 [Bombardia bombarda]
MSSNNQSTCGEIDGVAARPSACSSDADEHPKNLMEPAQKNLVQRLSESLLPGATETLQKMTSTAPNSLASTPPPDGIFLSQIDASIDMMRGIGCHFPSSTPSRASSLVIESRRGSEEAVASERAGIVSNLHASETTVQDETKMAVDADIHKTPVRGRAFVQPPLTPSPTPEQNNAKRRAAPSPPSAPRPAQRPRFESQPMRRDVDSDSRSERYFRESGTHDAFSNARQLAAGLWEFRSASPHGKNRLEARAPLAEPTNITKALGRIEDGYPTPKVGSAIAQDEVGTSISKVYSLLNFEIEDQAQATATSSRTTPSKTTTTQPPDHSHGKFTLTISWFTEDEIEQQLSALLDLYRAFYAGPATDDEDEDGIEDAPPAPAEIADPIAERARAARRTFKTVFENRLSSAEAEEFVLQEEEEDVMNAFMAWVREMGVQPGGGGGVTTEVFEDMQSCLGRLKELTVSPVADATWPFICRVELESCGGSIDRVIKGRLPGVRGVSEPARTPDGAMVWEFDEIFCGLEQSEAAQLASAWNRFMIRNE